jgi:hypothetical protein
MKPLAFHQIPVRTPAKISKAQVMMAATVASVAVIQFDFDVGLRRHMG